VVLSVWDDTPLLITCSKNVVRQTGPDYQKNRKGEEFLFFPPPNKPENGFEKFGFRIT
jgi:hypothetical protein